MVAGFLMWRFQVSLQTLQCNVILILSLKEKLQSNTEIAYFSFFLGYHYLC